MRLFGGERIESMLGRLGEEFALENSFLSSAIENAQKKVEGRNFETRKHVLQYDDVMNQQREIIYAQRRRVLDGENMKEQFSSMIKNRIEETVEFYCNKDIPSSEWDLEPIKKDLVGIISAEIVDSFEDGRKGLKPDDITAALVEDTLKRYEAKEAELGSDVMREAERVVMLMSVDENWMTHIDAIDQLKYGVGLQAYGHRDPVVEYKFQAFNMFEDMNKTIQDQAVRGIFSIQVKRGDTIERKAVAGPGKEGFAGEGGQKKETKSKPQSYTRQGAKVGRNDPCPCGSGKKYKNCCGE
jgi:preprotein translocase subunit SecA